MKRFLLPAIPAFLGLCLLAQAQDAPAPAQWNVTIECQMVVLPQKQALALLPELLDAAKIEAAYGKIQELIRAGEGQVVANLTGRVLAGSRLVAETVEELKYATQFDPPNLPLGDIEKPELLKEWPHVGIVPTAFESRNVGATLEAHVSVLGDGSFLEVEYTAQHIRFLRWEKTDCGRLANGERLFIESPIFHTMKNGAMFTPANAERVLVGTHKLVGTPEQIELIFLKATAVTGRRP